VSESQTQVIGDWNGRNEDDKTECIDLSRYQWWYTLSLNTATYRPEIVIGKRLPQTTDRNCLSVMHVTLGRVISQDTVDYNLDFAISEPSLRTEPRLGLDSRSRHEED
jgi:hypothetical protein